MTQTTSERRWPPHEPHQLCSPLRKTRRRHLRETRTFAAKQRTLPPCNFAGRIACRIYKRFISAEMAGNSHGRESQRRKMGRYFSYLSPCREWLICVPAAFLGCSRRFSCSLCVNEPRFPLPVVTTVRTYRRQLIVQTLESHVTRRIKPQ